jgi:DNA repair exonuclease SbcCD ATPase subunit
MILERLEVAGFRKFAAPFAFEPDERFTVIHAPNGTGKSTLLEAIHYGLLERFNVTGEEVKVRFKSAGRELTPSITVQFSVDDVRYRLEKKFIENKSALLKRYESGRFTSLLEGIAADDFVRELFSADPSKRGVLNRSSNLGFAHILWSAANARFDDLPDAAGDKIRSMLGTEATAVTAGERAVQDLATKAYERYFSPGDGRYTTRAGTANIPGLQQRVDAARSTLTVAREEYGKLEQLTVDLEDRSADADRMSSVRADLRNQIDAAKTAADEYAKLAKRRDEALAEEKGAHDRHSALDATIRSLTDARAAVARTEGAVRDAEADAKSRRQTIANIEGRQTTARTAFEDANAIATAVATRSAAVTAAEKYAHDLGDVERLTAVLEAVREDEVSLAKAHSERGALLAPTTSELEALRTDAAELGKQEATIAASALTLEIDPRIDGAVEVLVGSRPGRLPLEAGNPVVIEGVDDGLVVDVPGFGRVRARGADGAGKARKKAREFRERIAAVEQRFGTAEIVELARRLASASEIDARIERLEASIVSRLAGASVADTQSERASASARVDAALKQYPQWSSSPPDARAMRDDFDRDLSAAQSAVRTTAAIVAEVGAERGRADSALAAADGKVNAAKVVLGSENGKIEQLMADGFADDTARLMAHAAAKLALDNARKALGAVNESIAGFAEDPALLRERLTGEEREAAGAAEEASKEAAIAKTKLESLAEGGAYTKFVHAEEELGQLERELAAEERHAAAVKALREAFEAVRDARIAAVVQPITDAATRYYTRIAGRSAGEIRIGPGLAPEGLVDASSGTFIEVNQTLSSGETEQIYISARLALAEVLASQEGRQLFVLDDALPVSDPNRLRRFLAILEELSRDRLQVIVATADKARYLGISGAKHLDLAAELLASA